jgi:NADP-dependent 3-hydroxy acid dehydrogenase YdfG
MKDKGIKVTSIMPGATWSDSWAGATLPEDRIMQSSDIGNVIWGAYDLSKVAVVEDLVIRPQLGDL